MMMMPNGMGMPPLLRLPLVLAPFLGWRPAVAQHVGCVASSSISSSNDCGEVSGLEIEAASSLLVLQHLLPEDHPGVEPHTNSTDWQCRRHWLLQLAATNVHLGVQSLSLLLARTQSVTAVSSLLKRSGTGTAAPFGMILVLRTNRARLVAPSSCCQGLPVRALLGSRGLGMRHRLGPAQAGCLQLRFLFCNRAEAALTFRLPGRLQRR